MKLVALSDVSESSLNGITASATDRMGGPKFLRITDIQDGTVDWSSVPFCDVDSRRLEAAQLRSGDIVFARTGATTGKSFLIRTCPANAVFASYLIRVRPNARVDSGFLSQFFCSPEYWNQISLKAAGAAQPGVNSSKLKELLIPLPPLPEQKRIAAILDQADELRRKRRDALTALRKLPHTVFVDQFGDPTTNSLGWPVVEFSELCTRVTVGVVIRPASYYREHGIPAIRGTNIRPEGFDLSDIVYFSDEDNRTKLSKSRIWTGDLVVVRSGRPGLAAIVPEFLNGANAIDVIIATPDKSLVQSIFLRDLLNSSSGRRLVLSESRGQVQQHFNVGSLSAARVIAPPLDIQSEFVHRIRTVEDRVLSMEISKQRLDALFASLQHRAFRGELTTKVAERELAEAG